MPKEFFIEQPTQKETKSKLKELKKYPDLRPRLAVAWPVTKEKEELLSLVNADAKELKTKENLNKIKKLNEDDDLLKNKISIYLYKKIEQKRNKFLKLLKRDRKIKTSEKLLSSRKPLFATSHIPELAKKILLLEDVSKILQEKHKDRFIGFVVFGSIAGGYSLPKSDIDHMLTSLKPEDEKIHSEFKSLIKSLNLKPCVLYSKYTDIKKFGTVVHSDQLFQGLFFGNRKKLLELQKQTLKKISKENWDAIRSNITAEETGLEKAANRLQVNKQKLERIKANLAILRTPPPLKEAREIINKRYKQELQKEKKE